MFDPFHPITTTWLLGSAAIAGVSGLIGALCGSLLAGRREKTQRRHAFVQNQLETFYSPLLALRSSVKALRTVGVKVSKFTNLVWQQHCEDLKHDPETLARWIEQHKQGYTRFINYDNEQFRKEALPAYKNMVAIFRDKLYLAEPATVVYLPKLIEFVELWERWLADTIPAEVIQKVGISEEELLPFYENLEKHHGLLRTKLSRGKA
ncbi:MAG: hypothetical protein WCE90_07190 [Candidatus Zixiibacteriota bacterium]